MKSVSKYVTRMDPKYLLTKAIEHGNAGRTGKQLLYEAAFFGEAFVILIGGAYTAPRIPLPINNLDVSAILIPLLSTSVFLRGIFGAREAFYSR